MGKGDRHTRPTRPFDSAELARLAARPEPDAELAFEDLEVPAEEPPAARVPLSRANTVHDPLTTQLLAEVARRSQTMEVTPEAEAATRQADDDDDRARPPARKRER